MEATIAAAYAADLRAAVKRQEHDDRAAAQAAEAGSPTAAEFCANMDGKMIGRDEALVMIAMKARFRVARVDRLEQQGERVWLLAEESLQHSGPTLHIVRVGRVGVMSTGSPHAHERSVQELFVLLRFYGLRERQLEPLAWRTEFTSEELRMVLADRDAGLFSEPAICRAYAHIQCPDQSMDAVTDQSTMQVETKRPTTRFYVPV